MDNGGGGRWIGHNALLLKEELSPRLTIPPGGNDVCSAIRWKVTETAAGVCM
jgi:hypothetical protein